MTIGKIENGGDNMKINLTIPGRPIPAQRMTQKTKWTDRAQKSLNYQEMVAWEWRRIARDSKFEGPVK